MIKSDLTLREAIAQFDRSPTNPVAEGYRAQRAEILKRFSLDKWPEMRIEAGGAVAPAGRSEQLGSICDHGPEGAGP